MALAIPSGSQWQERNELHCGISWPWAARRLYSTKRVATSGSRFRERLRLLVRTNVEALSSHESAVVCANRGSHRESVETSNHTLSLLRRSGKQHQQAGDRETIFCALSVGIPPWVCRFERNHYTSGRRSRLSVQASGTRRVLL